MVRDWPQKLNSIKENHRDPIEIKDTSRDLHSFTLSLWISLVTLIAVHGPDDPQTTIDYHHLDLSRDDGMDEQEIYLSVVHPNGGFWLSSWAT
jgi:hypothetical protein